MSIHHILCETSNMLVRGLIEFLLDFALNLLNDIVRPIIWVGALSAANLGRRLVIVDHFFYFEDHLLVVSKVGEELRNQRKLWYRNLIIKFLMAWTLILIIGSKLRAVTRPSNLAFFEVFVKLKSGRRVPLIIFGRFPSWVGVVVTWCWLFQIFLFITII